MQEETENTRLPCRPLQLKQEDMSIAPIDVGNIWKEDFIGRDKEARSLENLIAGQEGPLTLCLNGAWGTGKTFFLRRFMVQWESNNGKALYFNAWEDDNLDDPLVALIGQLWPLLKPAALQGLVKDLKECAWPLIKKLGLARLGIEGKDVASPAKNAFEEYSERTACRQHLKECLSKIAEHYASETPSRPLLFIIDELDRCRPTFAVELLERIKHLFSIKHMVFLVGVDLEQIKSSIQSVYGNIDAENYLHRFFDVTLCLKEPRYKNFVYTYLSRQGADANPERQHFASRRMNFAEQFCEMLMHYKLSLREMEIALRTFTLLQSVRSTSAGENVVLAAVMITLMMKNLEAYTHLLAWDLPIGKLIDAIFGDLSECDDLKTSNSPMGIVYYIYGLAVHYDDDSQQQQQLIALMNSIDSDRPFDINSPLIASCLRFHKEPGIKEVFRRIRQGRMGGYYNFKYYMREIDAHLQQIEDVQLA